MSRENQKVTIKVNGSFYVGDICYCLKSEVYHGVWGDKYHFEDGAFTDPETRLQFAIMSTAYGDGCYYDTDGHEFPVDAGNIGIVDMGLAKRSAEELNDNCGVVFNYDGEVSIEYDHGTITVEFGDDALVIETSDTEDDWYDTDWEEPESEEDEDE